MTRPPLSALAALRPTAHWRSSRDEQAARVAAGTLPPADAFLADLFPDAFLGPCDELCARFESAVAVLAPTAASYDAAFAAIEAFVVALNELNDEGAGGWIETDERERLCEYVDEVLRAVGFDVRALAASRGLGEHEITDDWRDW